MHIIFLYYADQCFHHFDDFICPKKHWLGKVKNFFVGHDLKAQSLKEHLCCYPAKSPHTLRAILCQDASAVVEDITCKFTHVFDGYSCHRYGQPQLNPNSKVLSVRACLWYHTV